MKLKALVHFENWKFYHKNDVSSILTKTLLTRRDAAQQGRPSIIDWFIPNNRWHYLGIVGHVYWAPLGALWMLDLKLKSIDSLWLNPSVNLHKNCAIGLSYNAPFVHYWRPALNLHISFFYWEKYGQSKAPSDDPIKKVVREQIKPYVGD